MVPRRTRRIASAAVALSIFATCVAAQIGRPEPLNTPVMEIWRVPIEYFLRGFDIGDSETLLQSTRMRQLDDRHFVVRVEHESTCVRDMCLTAIGSMQEGRFQPKAMFFAGKMVTQGDTISRGNVRPPVMFFRAQDATLESDSVVVVETRNGWVVGPQSK
jgi:hypothetical protein